MSRRPARILVSMRRNLIVAVLLCACGPKAEDDDDGGGSLESGGSASDEVGDTTAPGCDSDPDIGPAVDIVVRHEGTMPLFVVPHGCGGALAFEIADADGVAVPYLLDSECSPNTCEEFVASPDCSVGCNDCGVPQAARIDAGATGDGVWPGRSTTELALSSACTAAPTCPATCVRAEQAPAGTYEITLRAYRTCTGPCECDGPPAPAVCGLWSGETLSDPITFSATIDYPVQTSVELVITD